MIFTVYGLRLKGDREVRYIGQTNGPLIYRLRGHMNTAQRVRYGSPLTAWLLDHRAEVEIFPIAQAISREEAQTQEAAYIKHCLALGQRLFNLKNVPVAQRVTEIAA